MALSKLNTYRKKNQKITQNADYICLNMKNEQKQMKKSLFQRSGCSIVAALGSDHVPRIPLLACLGCQGLQGAAGSPVERRLMEADRLKMCSMMWLKEHETCSPTGATHGGSRDGQQLKTPTGFT